jgi:potassium channel subfamily K
MRSLSKSQSQPTANDTVDEAHGDTIFQFSSDNPNSRPRFVDEQIDVVESPVDEKGINLANSLTPEDNASVIAKDEALKDIDQLLIKRVLQLAVELETQARVLLMHAMPKGSQSEVLLRADMVR